MEDGVDAADLRRGMAVSQREERFQPVAGLPGKVYVPKPCGPRKHPCDECFSCQWCGDARCSVCRRGGSEPGRPADTPNQETDS